MRVILFANGAAQPGAMVWRVLDDMPDAYILCADGGALHALRFQRQPQTIIGDFDSLTDAQAAQFTAEKAELIRYPTDKDETDLELALCWAAGQGATAIAVIGGLGGRFDQTLANAHLLTLPQLNGIDVKMVAGKQSIRLLKPGRHQVAGQAGDTLSLLPIGGAAHNITARGLKYPLRDESLAFGPARGLSNVMLADRADIELQAGMLLVVHTIGRA